jgi:hypothetical protein
MSTKTTAFLASFSLLSILRSSDDLPDPATAEDEMVAAARRFLKDANPWRHHRAAVRRSARAASASAVTARAAARR